MFVCVDVCICVYMHIQVCKEQLLLGIGRIAHGTPSGSVIYTYVNICIIYGIQLCSKCVCMYVYMYIYIYKKQHLSQMLLCLNINM